MLEAKQEFEKIRADYQRSREISSHNFLIYGNIGTGKTRVAATAPGPVLFHSFDPGGTRTLDTLIRRGIIPKGKVLVEEFSAEDAYHPTMYSKWKKRLDELVKEEFFKHIGTYVLDSLTSWNEAIMDKVIQEDKKMTAGMPPQIQNYDKHQSIVRNLVKILCELPCNFILTGHIGTNKDEVTGRIMTVLEAHGRRLNIKVPIQFDEVYITSVVPGKDGPAWKLQVNHDGRFVARTRIGSDGIFNTFEEPNITALLKKAGIAVAEKPYFF